MSRGKGSTFNDVATPQSAPRPRSRKLGQSMLARPPERFDDERYCHCGTKLNSYNPGDTCYAHAPFKVRRIRAAHRY